MCSCRERDRAIEREVTSAFLTLSTLKDLTPAEGRVPLPPSSPPLQVPLRRISSRPVCAQSRWSPGPGPPSAGASAPPCRGLGALGRCAGWVANRSGLKKSRMGDSSECRADCASTVCSVFPSWAALAFSLGINKNGLMLVPGTAHHILQGSACICSSRYFQGEKEGVRNNEVASLT